MQYVAGVSGGSHRGGARLDEEEEGQCTPVTSAVENLPHKERGMPPPLPSSLEETHRDSPTKPERRSFKI